MSKFWSTCLILIVKKSTEFFDTMAQNAEHAFGKSVTAQHQFLDNEAKAFAMSKIEMVLCRAQIPQISRVSNPPIFQNLTLNPTTYTI